MGRLLSRLRDRLCCAPPPRVTGLLAATGGGSGEVIVAWDPVPPGTGVAVYRVYRRVSPGLWRLLAAVEPTSHDSGFPGKVVMLDWPGAFPGGGSGGGDEDATGRRTYAVAAVGPAGTEGHWSMPASASPA